MLRSWLPRAGARVVGVDSAPRLLDVAREWARAEGVELDLREGDLLALPIQDAAADAVLSVFGVIFAPDPAQALREIARVLRPGGRALLSAWVPAGPIDWMINAELPVRGASPEAYVAAGQEQPMSIAARPVIEQAGAEAEAREAMTTVLRQANEDPNGFLIHSPYVVHELRVECTSGRRRG